MTAKRASLERIEDAVVGAGRDAAFDPDRGREANRGEDLAVLVLDIDAMVGDKMACFLIFGRVRFPCSTWVTDRTMAR